MKALGTNPMGYFSYELGGPINHELPKNPGGNNKHGIVTPHASFLALRLRSTRGACQSTCPHDAVPHLQPARIP